MDKLVLGRRIRFFRKERGLTLEGLGELVNMLPSQLSLIENGKREPKLSVLQALAEAFELELSELVANRPPDERSRLELDVERAQSSELYAGLNLPRLGSTKGLSDDVLRVIAGMYRELERREAEASLTPEEARRANTELRLWLRERNNYMPELEEAADRLMSNVEPARGALAHHTVAKLAKHLGFELIYVNDLPDSTRSITDLENGRIYLPPASIPGGHGLRAMALQAMAHRVLGHNRPRDYADFLRQRLEINYFAAACLMPRDRSVAFLSEAKKRRDLAVEAVSYTHLTLPTNREV